MSTERHTLIFGSSHCTALIKAAQTYYPEAGIIGGPLQRGPYWLGRYKYIGPFFDEAGGRLSFVDPLAAGRFNQVMKAAGLPADLLAFDGPFLLAFGVGSDSAIRHPLWQALWREYSLLPDAGRHFLSRAAFTEMMRSERRHPLRFIEILRQHGKRVYCLPNPPPRFTPKWMLPDEAVVIHRACVQAMSDLCAELGAEVIDAGPRVTSANGYLPVDLRGDPVHANIEYGRRVIGACLEVLGEAAVAVEA